MSLLVIATQLIRHVLLRVTPVLLLLVRLGLNSGPVLVELRQLFIDFVLPRYLVHLCLFLSSINTVP